MTASSRVRPVDASVPPAAGAPGRTHLALAASLTASVFWYAAFVVVNVRRLPGLWRNLPTVDPTVELVAAWIAEDTP